LTPLVPTGSPGVPAAVATTVRAVDPAPPSSPVRAVPRPAAVEVRAVEPAPQSASRPGPRRRRDRAEIESLATALVVREVSAAGRGFAPSSGRRDRVRLVGDGEAPFEVHIDRVEIVQPAPPAAPPARPSHRGFAELAATRGHARRGWW
jgi:hypothetical protein